MRPRCRATAGMLPAAVFSIALALQVAASAAEATRVGILYDGHEPDIQGLLDHVGVDLSHSERLIVLERMELQRLFAEHALSLQAETGPVELARIGQLLECDPRAVTAKPPMLPQLAYLQGLSPFGGRYAVLDDVLFQNGDLYDLGTGKKHSLRSGGPRWDFVRRCGDNVIAANRSSLWFIRGNPENP